MKSEVIISLLAISAFFSLAFSIKARLKNTSNSGNSIPNFPMLTLESKRDKISPRTTALAINKLYEVVKKYEPEHIVGINTGGVMLSSLFVTSLKLDTEKFSRCMVIPGKNRIECDNLKISGKALLIDDISRTGTTLSLASQYLKNNCNNIDEIFICTLATYVDEMNIPEYQGLNFSPLATRKEDILLPWTKNIPLEKRIARRDYAVTKLKKKAAEEIAWKIKASLSEHNHFAKDRLITSFFRKLRNLGRRFGST